jgi:hypothetical protein
MLGDCATSKQAISSNWDSVLAIASLINPTLLAEQTVGVWNMVSASPCLKSMAPEYSDWIRLFAAVGLRDARQMAPLSDALVASARTSAQMEYLAAAGATGYLALEDVPHARQILWKTARNVPKERRALGWYRYLAQAAGT